MRQWKKRIFAMLLSAAMVLGSAALATGVEKTISVTPMGLSVNGQTVTPTKSDGTAAQVFSYDGATYVPLRYLSELLGIEVEWDKNDPNTAILVNVPIAGDPSAEKSQTPGEAAQRVTIPYASSILAMAREIISKPQIYTEAQIKEIPDILNAKHRYFWCVDLQDYEAMRDVYTDEGPGGFHVDWGSGEMAISIDEQIQSCIATTGPEENMVPMHFGHNQIVRFIDDTHAQILTRMNDRHTYKDDGEVYAGWGLYVDDVMKCKDGAWRISCVRLAYGVMENQLRAMKK